MTTHAHPAPDPEHARSGALGVAPASPGGPAPEPTESGPVAGPATPPEPEERSEEFRRLLVRAVVVPALLLAGLAAALGIGVGVLVRQARLTERSDRVLAETAGLRELLVDRETGLRGYLLSGDGAFLEPLRRADAELPAVLARLQGQLADRSGQAARLGMLEEMSRAWSGYAGREQAMFERGEDYIRFFRTGEGLQRLSAMLEVLDAFGREEQVLRAERARNAALAGRLLLVTTVACVGLLGVVLAQTSRRNLLALARSHRAALAAMEERERQIRELNASLEARVAERTRELRAANGELEAFAGSVSHDLRAPLRQVSGLLRMLEESAAERLDGKERSLVTMARGISGDASRMVDDLLSFTRVSRAEMQTWTVDLGALVQSAREGLSHELAGRDVRWTVQALPSVRGDPSMLLLVLRNLLGNAVKYTRRRPTAHVEVGAAPCSPSEVLFYVKDDGVGFDMKHVHKLFGVFQRLHGDDEFEGTGMGLAHVRRIVERHGGRVWATGAPGQGATFWVALPRAPGPDATSPASPPPSGT